MNHALPLASHTGLAGSAGWAIGTAHVLAAHALAVAHTPITAQQIAAEQAQLRVAIAATLAELSAVRACVAHQTHTELTAFIEVHELMLHDPVLVDGTLDYIAQHCVNAAWALSEQVQTLAATFLSMDDAYLRERAFDVQQVGERVLKHLTAAPAAAAPAPAAQGQLILVAHDLAPADFIQWQHAGVRGLVTEVGGTSSHTAIVARAQGLPAVLAVNAARQHIVDGDVLAIDGGTGRVWVNPAPDTLAGLHAQANAWRTANTTAQSALELPASTRCGQHIELMGNIESQHDMPAVLAARLDGVGLMRSEFLFMGRAELPDEAAQTAAYSAVVQALGGKPATIRTLDVGADKLLNAAHAQSVNVSPNPALGLRAVRYCLANPALFTVQLRALLRAAAHGPVNILLPMIASIDEVRACKALLTAAQAALRAEGTPQGAVRLGAMIEIPAAAIAIDHLLAELDFCSVGTNDLIQYTLAIDRNDSAVAHLYNPRHPAMDALLAQVFKACAAANKPVTVCGEMAGDAELTHHLLDLGLRRFSLAPSQAAAVKAAVRCWGEPSAAHPRL